MNLNWGYGKVSSSICFACWMHLITVFLMSLIAGMNNSDWFSSALTQALGVLPTSYWQVPTFGSDTIWKFSTNVSELKKLVAPDYKDLLQVSLDSIFISTTNKQCFCQCSIPVFEGLLPEPHNSVIMVLLFTCCNWHGLAKLRMHTDLTLGIFDTATICETSKKIQGECWTFLSDDLWA